MTSPFDLSFLNYASIFGNEENLKFRADKQKLPSHVCLIQKCASISAKYRLQISPFPLGEFFFSLHLSAWVLRISVRIRPRLRFC